MARLSNSSIDKFKECAMKYKYHYILRIREELIGSPLFFGSSIDNALNELLRTKMKGEKDFLDPKEIFIQSMHKFEYNKEELILPFTLKTQYSMSDFDPDLITGEYYEKLEEYLIQEEYENTNPLEIMEQLLKFIRASGFAELPKEDKMFYNFACWTSLVVKGYMMIEAYESELLPKIKEVKAIQVKVNLPNDNGDHITGYEDFKAILVDPEIEMVCDNKTSSRKYKDDSVRNSQQLAIYTEYEDLEYAAFFVLNKKVRKTKRKTCLKCSKTTLKGVKTCPEPIDMDKKATGKNRCNGDFSVELICSIDTQIITDKITEEQKEATFGSFEDILYSIKNEDFPKNQKDNCFAYGKRCCYYEKCWSNDPESMEGLVQLPESEEK